MWTSAEVCCTAMVLNFAASISEAVVRLQSRRTAEDWRAGPGAPAHR